MVYVWATGSSANPGLLFLDTNDQELVFIVLEVCHCKKKNFDLEIYFTNTVKLRYMENYGQLAILNRVVNK